VNPFRGLLTLFSGEKPGHLSFLSPRLRVSRLFFSPFLIEKKGSFSSAFNFFQCPFFSGGEKKRGVLFFFSPLFNSTRSFVFGEEGFSYPSCTRCWDGRIFRCFFFLFLLVPIARSPLLFPVAKKVLDLFLFFPITVLSGNQDLPSLSFFFDIVGETQSIIFPPLSLFPLFPHSPCEKESFLFGKYGTAFPTIFFFPPLRDGEGLLSPSYGCRRPFSCLTAFIVAKSPLLSFFPETEKNFPPPILSRGRFFLWMIYYSPPLLVHIKKDFGEILFFPTAPSPFFFLIRATLSFSFPSHNPFPINAKGPLPFGPNQSGRSFPSKKTGEYYRTFPFRTGGRSFLSSPFC